MESYNSNPFQIDFYSGLTIALDFLKSSKSNNILFCHPTIILGLWEARNKCEELILHMSMGQIQEAA